MTPVHVTKYDGTYHRCITLRYVMRRGRVHFALNRQGDIITRTRAPADDPAPYRFPADGEAFLFEDRWFHVWRSRRAGGMHYNVDIATPVEFDGAQFNFVDLDLDVAWLSHDEPIVEDEDEFVAHAQRMRYPAAVIEQARSAVDEVLGLIARRAFPFDRA